MSLLDAERIRGAVNILNGIFSSPSEIAGPRPRPGTASANQEKDKDENTPNEEPSISISTSNPPSPVTSFLPLPPLTLISLHPMHQPQHTSILYATPLDPHKHLQTFCQNLKETFTRAGFMMPEAGNNRRYLLLHATIVNTIYVPGVRDRHQARDGGDDESRKPQSRNAGHGRRKARLTFDARAILEKYRDYEWMRDVRLEKVAICRMGARKRESGIEEYEVEAEVDVPLSWA
ncbi:hypothetical protein DSL72_002685 [Monilinia vaccinii-corymbosi]|uniref:A-kinase anchor protein 7-like phosphoesterase domain-containing protein n=1 Tax=Monilinia vaccinii-corymbosi TaxID=61207 RepID=A0A8A3PDD5_9HELO|nr:hypothetical protein DSL72_002685 [Monilinia vaccinii-corymbosi]